MLLRLEQRLLLSLQLTWKKLLLLMMLIMWQLPLLHIGCHCNCAEDKAPAAGERRSLLQLTMDVMLQLSMPTPRPRLSMMVVEAVDELQLKCTDVDVVERAAAEVH